MANFIPKITYTELITLTPKTITFDSPPEGDPVGEQDRTFKKIRRSTNGTLSTQFGYNTKRQSLEFTFQPKTVKDAFQDFYLNHASKGGEFEYFESEDEIDSNTFTLLGSSQGYARPIPNTAGTDFEYDFRFSIERVI